MDQAEPTPQDAPRVNEHDEESVDYDKLIDLLMGARPDAIQFFNHGNNEAGIRMRKTLHKADKYSKHLRQLSLAISKGEELPVFDWVA